MRDFKHLSRSAAFLSHLIENFYGFFINFFFLIARQIGFEDASECPHLCKLANQYLKKSKECETSLYEYFAEEPNPEVLYVKLVEEFDRCILSYFAFHWSQASLMISQVLIQNFFGN